MYSTPSPSQLFRSRSRFENLSLTASRSNRRDSYTAEDEFCEDLDRRLSLVREFKDKRSSREWDEGRDAGVSGNPKPWWPFPDSRHCSALETHTHRVSVVNTRGSPGTVSPSRPPSRLQKRRYRRKISADDICKDANQLRPLTTVDPTQEQKRPSKKDRVPTRTEAALIQEEETRRRGDIAIFEQCGVEDDFVYPEPAAPPLAKLTKAQQIRQTTTRRVQARKEKPVKTVYKTFDEKAFGKRSSTPLCPRRKSLLSSELKAEDDKTAESGQHSPLYSPLGPDGTRIEPVTKRQTPSPPRSDLRRDSGYDDEDVYPSTAAPRTPEYDFGHQDILF